MGFALVTHTLLFDNSCIYLEIETAPGIHLLGWIKMRRKYLGDTRVMLGVFDNLKVFINGSYTLGIGRISKYQAYASLFKILRSKF